MKAPWEPDDVVPFGKRLMLGKSWLGVKYFKPESDTAQQGAIYYASKKKK